MFLTAPRLTSCLLPITLGLLAGCGQSAPFAKSASNQEKTSVALMALSEKAAGWFLAGADASDYSMQGDPTSRLILTSSSAPADQFGTAMTDTDATSYVGKRLRLTALVSSDNVSAWAGLWMRVDGDAQQILAFDNMENRPITATSPAAAYSVVLDVDANATHIAYGVLLAGPGTVTASSLALEVVDASVPETAPSGGWFLAGSNPENYLASGNPQSTAPGALDIRSSTATSDEFGTAMTEIAAAPYIGKRLRLSATVATKDVTAWAGLWFRVDGAEQKMLAFDNMQNRPIVGTTGSAVYSVVLDVAPGAKDLAYGILLAGQGRVDVSGLTLEPVDASVATTCESCND